MKRLGLSILFVLFAGPALGQYLSVIDGYDVPFGWAFGKGASFDPNLTESWELRYFSGRHLRTLAPRPLYLTQTYAGILANPGQTARILDREEGGPGADWVAFFDDARSRQVILRPVRDCFWGGRVPSLPVITSQYFDALPGRTSDERIIDWVAGYRDDTTGESNVVFYDYRESAWRADTLAVLPGLIRSIRILKHTLASQSVAAATDTLFWARVWSSSTEWQDFQAPLPAAANELHGATLPDGSPIWVYGTELYQVRGNELFVVNVPIDSTVLSASNLGLIVDASGGVHILYRVRDANLEWSTRYAYHKDDQWRVEVVLTPVPAWHYGAITVAADTVFAGVVVPRQREVLLARRNPEGGWQVTRVDRAGDVGQEISAAGRPPHLFEHAAAFFDRTNGDLKAAFSGDVVGGYPGSWLVQKVDTAGVVGRFPRVVASENRTDIIYFDESRGLLKHARQSPSGYYVLSLGLWEIETVDTVGAMTLPPGLLQGSDDTFDLAYQSAASGSIRFGHLSPSGWQIEDVTQADLVPPGEISLFRTEDSLFVGFIEQGELRLAVRRAPGDWEVRQVPSPFEPFYAAWAADPQGNLHAVYRVRRGFRDEIRHALRSRGAWSDNTILTTLDTGTWLRLKWAGSSWPSLILVFADDGRARAYSYENQGWFPVASGLRLMSDTAVDFTLTDVYTLTLFYRALTPPLYAYEPDPYPEVVADVVISIIDEVEEVVEAEREMTLSAYPNPFNEQTTIEYTVPIQGRVQIELYDLLGRRLQTLRDEMQPAGRYRLSFSGGRYASGVYFCRYSIAGEKGVRKLVLMK